MSDITPQIARLVPVDIRSAWSHEALHFTPWLYANLDALGEAIGLSLEGEDTEVAVESFSADILARNRFDDTRVLIENQLECSDHSHLGQILTYLAGLDAKTVVWVASDFREPHLSAINWLNENTDESISFFAVRLRVVQIAGSPLAPIFDVVARPNNWERRLHAASAPSREGKSELAERRNVFWRAFVERVPGQRERGGEAAYTSNRWIILDDPHLIISMFVSRETVGIFLRAPNSETHGETREKLSLLSDALTHKLGVAMGNSDKHFFVSSRKGDYTDAAQHNELIDWLRAKADIYEAAVKDVLGSKAAS